MEQEELENLIRKELKELDITTMDAFILSLGYFTALNSYLEASKIDPEDMVKFFRKNHSECIPIFSTLIALRWKINRFNNNSSLHQSDTSEKRFELSPETTESY
jgi:hypothetical protein